MGIFIVCSWEALLFPRTKVCKNRRLTNFRKRDSKSSLTSRCWQFYSQTYRKRPPRMSSLGGRLQEVITYQSSDHFAGHILHMVTTETYPSFKCLIHLKCQFRKEKYGSFCWNNFHALYYPRMRWYYSILFSNFRSIICSMVAHWRSKTGEENYKLTRGGRLQEVPNIVIWHGNFRYFRKLVAEERWSLTRAIVTGSTAYYMLLCHSWSTANQQQTITCIICELKS